MPTRGPYTPIPAGYVIAGPRPNRQGVHEGQAVVITQQQYNDEIKKNTPGWVHPAIAAVKTISNIFLPGSGVLIDTLGTAKGIENFNKNPTKATADLIKAEVKSYAKQSSMFDEGGDNSFDYIYGDVSSNENSYADGVGVIDSGGGNTAGGLSGIFSGILTPLAKSAIQGGIKQGLTSLVTNSKAPSNIAQVANSVISNLGTSQTGNYSGANPPSTATNTTFDDMIGWVKANWWIPLAIIGAILFGWMFLFKRR